MTARRLFRMFLVIAIMPTMMGSFSACPERQGKSAAPKATATVKAKDPVKSNRNPAERISEAPGQHKAWIRVDSLDPYQVIITTWEEGHPERGQDFTDPPIKKDYGGETLADVTYTPGQHITIVVTVKQHPDLGDPSHYFTCEIRDGFHLEAHFGRGLVQCNWTTNR